MTTRKVEIFSAGCPLCKETEDLVSRLTCSSCEVSVVDMHDLVEARRAKDLGVQSVPAVAVNGKLAECCSGRAPDEATLVAAGLGQALS